MLIATICFIACHGASADHFATFANALLDRGQQVELYATGQGLKKFQDRKMDPIYVFSLENISEETAAIELAKQCSQAAVVVTDVGHPFAITLHKTLAEMAPITLRFAYYDNPEPYVPGGYSYVATQVMLAAQKVFFANENLINTPIYKTPSEEISLPTEQRVGIGYYPIAQAEKIAERRLLEKDPSRAALLSKYSLSDEGQKILVYAGGNNEVYFSKAFPTFLQFLEKASKKEDLSHFIVLLQQHPGAKKENLDAKQVLQWTAEKSSEKTPLILLSEMNSDEAQVVTDAMLYYQTSMGPQFVLANIPTLQIGHDTYEDVLIKNKLCSSVTSSAELLTELTLLQKTENCPPNPEIIYQGLGIRSDWTNQLEDAFSKEK